MQTTLDALKPGDQAVVSRLEGDPQDFERLMELGLIAGTPVKILKFAPLGDPIEILMRGYHLSLRRTEAAHVIVDV